MKWPLLNLAPNIPPEGSVGDFAFKRSFYYHPGIDLYCEKDQTIQAIEDGIIVKIDQFTGTDADPPSPWWLDTWSVLIECESGVIGYCELIPHPYWRAGMKIHKGQEFAIITPVLKKDKGNGTTMLHLEHYVHGTREHVTWAHNTPQPAQLLNPRKILNKIIDG